MVEGAGPRRDDSDLIARVDRARSHSLVAYAAAYRARYARSQAIARPIAGGVAAYIAGGSPINQLVAAGLDGPVTADGLREVEAFFARFGSGFQVWVGPGRDIAPFIARGYDGPTTMRVFARDPAPLEPAGSPIAIERVLDGSPAGATAYGRLAATAFGSPTPVMVRLFAAYFGVPDARLYRATVDGRTAGVGRLLVHAGVAEFGGGATLREFRGRGVQLAMLRHRVNEASAAGCSLLITAAEPDGGSTRNILRAGFEPAFDYAVFRWPGLER